MKDWNWHLYPYRKIEKLLPWLVKMVESEMRGMR